MAEPTPRPSRPSDFTATDVDLAAPFVLDGLSPNVSAVLLPDGFGGHRLVGYLARGRRVWTWHRADVHTTVLLGGGRTATRMEALAALRANLNARPLGQPAPAATAASRAS